MHFWAGWIEFHAHFPLDHVFLSRDIQRIQAVIDKENLASKRVLESGGFKKEGTLRKALWNAKGEVG